MSQQAEAQYAKLRIFRWPWEREVRVLRGPRRLLKAIVKQKRQSIVHMLSKLRLIDNSLGNLSSVWSILQTGVSVNSAPLCVSIGNKKINNFICNVCWIYKINQLMKDLLKIVSAKFLQSLQTQQLTKLRDFKREPGGFSPSSSPCCCRLQFWCGRFEL